MKNNQLAAGAVADFTACLEQGEFDYGIVTLKGIVLRDEVSEEKWLTLTRNVAAMYEATGVKHQQAAFMMGDLLKWGEERFGEKYADIIDATRAYMRVHVKTLSNWQWIAGKIAPSRRRENLSLAHHEAVAKLDSDEQEEFLQLAEDEGMSVKELRNSIRERHPGKPRTQKVKTIVSIDTDNPEAVTDALQIIANHLSNPDTEIINDWKEHMDAIHRAYRRKWQSGVAKSKHRKEAP